MKTRSITFLGLVEKGFVVLLLFSFATISKQVFFYVLYPVILFLVFVRWKSIARLAIKEKPLWVLMMIVLVSVFWSAAPEITLIRSFAFIGTTLFGTYVATRYSLNEQMKLLACALGIAAFLSLVATLVFPEYGISQELHQGAWRGIFEHKNLLGRHMVISTLVFLLLAISHRSLCWLMWIGFAISLSLVLFSTSKTALVTLVTLLALLPLYNALRWSYTWVVPFLIAAVLTGSTVSLLLVANVEATLKVLGKDTNLTFTGRTDLWAALLERIWERPWLGYGYGGFWQGWEGESADIWQVTGWMPPHAHNSFLETWLALGIVGLLVSAIVWLQAVLRALAWVRSTKSAIGFWPPIYLTLMFLVDQVESSLGARSFFWLLYVSTLLSTHNSLTKYIKNI